MTDTTVRVIYRNSAGTFCASIVLVDGCYAARSVNAKVSTPEQNSWA